mmetsp:Transcript_2861/g.11589  ORF Transcript_2861/g.11589 Transcript_2861/m.11589 type:complete len:216 (-) Transcript_2861:642-1289(-)
MRSRRRRRSVAWEAPDSPPSVRLLRSARRRASSAAASSLSVTMPEGTSSSAKRGALGGCSWVGGAAAAAMAVALSDQPVGAPCVALTAEGATSSVARVTSRRSWLVREPCSSAVGAVQEPRQGGRAGRAAATPSPEGDPRCGCCAGCGEGARELAAPSLAAARRSSSSSSAWDTGGGGGQERRTAEAAVARAPDGGDGDEDDGGTPPVASHVARL